MQFAASKPGLAVRQITAVLATLCLLAVAQAAAPGIRYAGQVLYRGNKAPAPGVLVELVEAQNDGKPTDEVLGSARADDKGRFAVTLANPTNDPVALVVSAVRSSAESGGNRREEGYEINHHRTRLGFLSHPSAVKPNTLFIERHKIGLPGNGDDS